MKNFLNPLPALGITAIAVMMSSVANAEATTSPGATATPEQITAKREARRAEIAGMIEEERRAFFEQRRQERAERGAPTEAQRQARRERMGNMSDQQRAAMRDRMGQRRASGVRRPGRGPAGPGGRFSG